MHIAIDCRLGGVAHAGIGRYITHLVQELITVSPSETKWTMLCVDQLQATEVLGSHRKRKNVQVHIVPVRHYTVREQLVVLAALAQIRPDVFHVPHFNAPIAYWGKTIVTIHDLLWHEMKGTSVTTLPAWQYWLKYFFYTLVTKRSITHAAAVLVPSKSVADTITTYYPTATRKITVTNEGVSTVFLKKRKMYNWHDSTGVGMLYVGSLYPHKNIEVVLQALQSLPDSKLTIVGSRSAFSEQVQKRAEELDVSSQVTYLGRLGDKKLATLYQNCEALIQPSKSEGFGLTGIEAMACSTPVLCSNIPVFREIYGEHAIYFDPYSVQSFLAAHAQLKLKKTQDRVVQAHQFAARYTWRNTAEQTLAVYKTVEAGSTQA